MYKEKGRVRENGTERRTKGKIGRKEGGKKGRNEGEREGRRRERVQ